MEFDSRRVAEHKTKDEAYMAIHGVVYDVTKYIIDHPGGAEVLIEAAGTDATEAFDSAGHSEDALEIMADFKVGTLKGYTPPKPKKTALPPKPKPQQQVQPKHRTTKFANLSLFSFVVTAAYFAVSKYGHTSLPHWVTHAMSNKKYANTGGFGFTKGLLVGGGIFAVVDYYLATHFAKYISPKKSFTSYPAHMKLPEPVQEDTLLQRGLLDPVTYSHLPLQAKTKVSSNVLRLTFKLPTSDTILGLPIGQHVAIKAEVDGESVARSYTPVSNNNDRGILELVIKVYPGGKLTDKYLAKLEIGDEVLFRGPKGAMRYHKGLANKIGMVAGGTGITPMFQIIRAICEDDRDLTEVSLIYANRSEDDILLREQLDKFARRYPKNFNIWYMLDHPPANWNFGSGYVTKDLMKEKLPAAGIDTKIMLCGPPGMVNASKKSLVDLGFESPGAMSKMTDQIFLF